jgi:RpiB/LacA/LacB family sugar-phosphate isomerase
MKVALGTDHAGFELKAELAKTILALGHEVVDVGAFELDATDDYPDFAEKIALAIADEDAERGVLICGSGVGASIAANKFHGIRAGNVTDTYSAHQGVEHDQMNVLVLGSRVVGPALATELVKAFLGAEFSGEERHVRRLNKISLIERRPTG